MALTPTRRRQIFADDHEAFRDSVARYIATGITPHLEDWRSAGAVPREVFAEAGDSGFLGTALAEEFGGGGAQDLGFLAVLVEETATAGSSALSLLWGMQAGVAIPVLAEGNCTQWLPGLAAGKLIAVAAAGDVTVSDGRVSGSLLGVCGARLADLILVDLRDTGVAAVEVDQHGVTIDPGTALLAGREAGMAKVTLTDAAAVMVPAAMKRHLDLWLAVSALASARAALALGVEYVSTRKVFGRPLAEFENTRLRLAELAAGLATATAFLDSGLTAGPAISTGDAATARWVALGQLDATVDQCLQLHGGYGYMREYPISTAFADARFLRLVAQSFSDPRTELVNELGL